MEQPHRNKRFEIKVNAENTKSSELIKKLKENEMMQITDKYCSDDLDTTFIEELMIIKKLYLNETIQKTKTKTMSIEETIQKIELGIQKSMEATSIYRRHESIMQYMSYYLNFISVIGNIATLVLIVTKFHKIINNVA